MKIAIFTDSYGPKIDGVVTLTQIMRQNFEKLGHEVAIVAPRPVRYKPKPDPAVYHLRAVSGLFFEGQYTIAPVSKSSTIQRLLDIKPDVVFFLAPGQVGLLGAKIAKQLKVPLVAIHTTDFYEYIIRYRRAAPAILAVGALAATAFDIKPSRLAKIFKDVDYHSPDETNSQSIVRQINKLIYAYCDLVLPPSAKLEKQLRDWGVDKTTPIRAVPCGVDALSTDLERQKYWRDKLNINKNDPVIIYVGRLAKEKNLDLLIDAFEIIARRNPQAKLLLVGGFGYKRTLMRKAAESDFRDRYIFVGKVPRQDLGNVYSISRVFAFPSLTDTQGLVLNEAALAGLPLVMVDTELTDLLIEGKTGFYAKNDATSLADALEEVLELPKDDWNKMSKAAQKQASKYSELKQAQKMLDALKLIKK